MSSKLFLCFAVLLAMAAPAAYAATASANLSVTATVVANCTISASSLAFGNYDPVVTNASSNLDATGTLNISCTSGSGSTVTLGQGSYPAGGSSDAAPLRRMFNSTTGYLGYALYQDSSRTVVWGNTAGTGVGYTGTGTGGSLTIYGRVAAGQNVPVGSYSDIVVATVTF